MKVSLNNAFYLATRVSWEHADCQLTALIFQMPVDQLPQSSPETLEIHLQIST